MGPLKKKKNEKRSKPTFKSVLTSIFATVAAIFLLLLAGLSLSGAAVTTIATMPLFLLFSPILVPAGLTTGLVATALAASGGSGMTALTIIKRLLKLLMGQATPAAGGAAGGAPADAAGGAPAGASAKPAAKPAAKPSW